MAMKRIEFAGHSAARLAARLDLPQGAPRAFALFAHCFTCSMDLKAVHGIASALAAQGIALMRFDFTGLGSSEGEFASTNFSSNVDDVLRAAEYLRAEHGAPALLIGHSLGGAAMLAAAHRIDGVKALVTIAAPSDVASVLDNFAADLAAIETDGEARVTLAGRRFTIRREFIDDARAQKLAAHVAELRAPLLILHAPEDKVVGIGHAAAIFAAAQHPKSFIALDGADHLLTRTDDAEWVGNLVATWAMRYIDR